MTIDDVVEVAPGPPPRGRRRAIAVGAVVAILAAGGGVAAWAATRGAGPASGAAGSELTCPDASTIDDGTQIQVPAEATASGVAGRLVPTRSPSAVVVCEYDPAGVTGVSVTYSAPTDSSGSPYAVPPASGANDAPVGSGVGLTRSTTVTTGGPTFTTLMSALQDATVRPSAGVDCAVDWVAPPTLYLVGLTYDDGVVWLATPDSCAGVTNGDSHTDATDIKPAAIAVLDATTTASSTPQTSTGVATPVTGSASSAPGGGTTGDPGSGATGPGTGTDPSEVPPSDPFGPCIVPGGATPAPGRALVSFVPTTVTICHQPVGPGVTRATATDRGSDVAAELAGAVNGSAPIAPDTMCPDIAGELWRVLFADAAGHWTSVLVDAGGCRTVSDGSKVLQADDQLFALLRTAD